MNGRVGPRTTVVVLNWNSGEMTAECIRSLLAMDVADFEILVVDNGSTDGSTDMLRRQFPQVELIPQARNLGFARGCNIGMRRALQAGVEYVLLLNNDTIVDAHLLSALYEVAEAHRDAAIVSPKIYYYGLPQRIWWVGGTFSLWTGIAKHIDLGKTDNDGHNVSREIDWATGCAMLVRTCALEELGLFDERFFLNSEDLDLSVRMRRAGYRIWYAPEAKLWHKEGVDRRKNGVDHVNALSGSRNLLWIMRKHATLLQWATFWPNFLCRYAAFHVVRSILRRDFRSAWAIMAGIGEFFTMRVDPEPSRVKNVAAASARIRNCK